MRVNLPRLSFVILMLGSCLLIPFSIGLLIRTNVNAQNCMTPRPDGGLRWPSGTNVTVIFDENSNFNQNEIDAMKKAFESWNSHNGTDINGNASSVTFSGFTVGQPPIADNSGANNRIVVISRGGVTPGYVAETSRVSTRDPTNQLTFAHIKVDLQEGVNGSLADFTSLLGHEIG